MQILGIIPARGGSKGIPQKNIRGFVDKPLIDWTIDVAKQSNLSDIIVTSDCDLILKHSKNKGVMTVKRPDELATDTALMLPTIKHAVQTFSHKKGIMPNAICLLQPTNPLRTLKTINDCIELISQPNVKSVTTVYEGIHPKKCYYVDGQPLIDTHEAYDRHRDMVLTRSGSIFMTMTEYIYEGFLLYQPKLYKTDKYEAVDINDFEDLYIAEALVKHMRSDGHSI